MRPWVCLTVALYVVLMSILAVPLILLLHDPLDPGDDVLEIVGAFYVFFAPVLILAEAVLLLVPVSVSQERPVRKRSVVTSAIIGAIPMAALVVAFVICILYMILGEDGTDPYLTRLNVIGSFSILWVLWGTIFWKTFVNEDPRAFTSSMTSWLLKGSILELVVAIPSHIISRRRDECCAPTITLFGIVMGLSIALMSFGPGVVFLFAKRIQQKRRAGK
jgi:hypothetical protein